MRVARAESLQPVLYEAATTSAANLTLMNLIDRHYTEYPWEGSRRIVQWLSRQGHTVNRKRV